LAPVINATAGDAAANSYLTISDADSIADSMLGTLAWTTASADDRARALVTATNGLDTLNFIGTKSADTQALLWPRTDAKCGDKAPATDEIPREIELSCFDLAEALLSDSTILRNTQAGGELVPGIPNADLRRLKLDVMEIEWKNTGSRTTRPASPLTALPHLRTLLGCLLVGQQSTNLIKVVRS
jgi:hypothetical protein